jgi:hypothetical protein
LGRLDLPGGQMGGWGGVLTPLEDPATSPHRTPGRLERGDPDVLNPEEDPPPGPRLEPLGG